MLVLAVELYYVPDTAAERRALLEAGLALARGRAPGPAVVGLPDRVDGRLVAAPARRPGALGGRGLAAARQAGDPAGVGRDPLVMAARRAGARGPAGLAPRLSEEASRLADRERLPYV